MVGELQTNCYLLVDGEELAVIDPGADAKLIISEIKKSGAKVKAIVNTHCHYDHTEANSQLREAFGAPIAIHEAEKPFVDFAVDRWLKDGDIVIVGALELRVVHTPGHTKGGICLFGSDFVLSGDTIFDLGIGRMDLAGGSCADMKQSLEKLDKLIPQGAMVYPGHGEIFKFQKGEVTKWI